ncbi:MAG: 5-(carboxyamino)imidazole ribonucleotide synthase [Herpetosiphonaceae bacterium]|nr:5-(carboxyamino)imidazole ribonucleotide synthase [Herpetosiphonaceae bacterium]
MSTPILPGATVGILGNGQLGRMLALAARRMGYRVHCFGPDHDSPAGQLADQAVCAQYDDLDAVRTFVQQVDVVTFEFENVSAAATALAAEYVPVRPDGRVLDITQHRLREKNFLRQAGFPVTPFHPVHSLAELENGLGHIGYPAVLKTAGFGYDGKGQHKLSRPVDLEPVFHALGDQEAILEAWVAFEREVSVVAARGVDGTFVHYGVIENIHHNHILDLSLAPARLAPELAAAAIDIARDVLEQLDVVGILCVEFFVTSDQRLLINELAPRPHNSGHLTIEAATTSQFEQQLRAVCGLPLGGTELLQPAAMCNLLGDRWEGGEPNWAAACAFPEVKLHLYGKQRARPGRKMGHLTSLGSTPEAAIERVLAARNALNSC